MRVECAWCGKELRSGPEPTSHGICPACTREFFPVPATPYASRPVMVMLDADGSRA